MAYRRRTKTRRPIRRRRKTARKRAGRKRVQPMSMIIRGGLPKRMFTSSSYFYYGLNTIASGTNSLLAVQSSPYACVTGVSNSQPLYFDTYKLLYNRCRVHGMRTTVQACYLPSASNTREVYFGVYNSPTASVPGTIEGAMQQPGAKSVMLPFDKTPRKLTIYNKCCYTLGTSKVMYNTDLTYQSLVSTVPSTMAYTNYWFYNFNGDITYVQFSIKVTLYVEYFEPTLVVNT